MPNSRTGAVLQALKDIAYSSLSGVVADSLAHILHRLSEHAHSRQDTYPTGAAGVTLTCGSAAPWTEGALTQVVPASTITSDFDIHHVSIEGLSANAVYELKIYYGAGDTLACSFRVTKNASQDQLESVNVMSPVIPANSVVKMSVQSSSGNADTADVSLQYHIY